MALQHRRQLFRRDGLRRGQRLWFPLLIPWCSTIFLFFIQKSNLSASPSALIAEAPQLSVESTSPALLSDKQYLNDSVTLKLAPNTSSITLNLGSNIDPILPKIREGPCAVTVAVEPIAFRKIPYHPQVYVVPTALSSHTGVVGINVYNENGGSSSLAKVTPNHRKRFSTQETYVQLVPSMTLTQLLSSLPENVPIPMLKTDLQGFDFAVVRDGIQAILKRRIPYLSTEVWYAGVFSFQGVDNDFCFHWLPFMREHGYNLVRLVKATSYKLILRRESDAAKFCESQPRAHVRAGMREGDAWWRLASLEKDLYPKGENPFEHENLLNVTVPAFNASDYRQCYLSTDP